MSDNRPSIEIFVDADACPVKDEVVRVAERHQLQVHMVSNSWMRLPQSPLVARVIVAEGPDAADDWIAERITPTGIAVTADIPLAARCLGAGARAVSPMGKAFSRESIGMTVAMRNLMTHLREAGEVRSFNATFGKAERSRFLQVLEQAVQDALRGRR